MPGSRRAARPSQPRSARGRAQTEAWSRAGIPPARWQEGQTAALRGKGAALRRRRRRVHMQAAGRTSCFSTPQTSARWVCTPSITSSISPCVSWAAEEAPSSVARCSHARMCSAASSRRSHRRTLTPGGLGGASKGGAARRRRLVWRRRTSTTMRGWRWAAHHAFCKASAASSPREPSSRGPVHRTTVLREARAATVARSTSSWLPSASANSRKARLPPRTGSTRSARVVPDTLSWRPRCCSSRASCDPSAAGEQRSSRGAM